MTGDAASLCRNCGAALLGPFCHACGQKGEVHRSLWALIEEFVHGILHLDGKVWRTLPALLFWPGRLTHDYVQGQRARYVSPLALFLAATLVLYAAMSVIPDVPADHARQRIEVSKLVAPEPASAADDSSGCGQHSLAFLSASQNQKICQRLANPDLLSYKIRSSAYKFAFLLVPLSLPFIWLLFAWQRERRLYDHTVFALYSLSFMTLLFIAWNLAGALDLGALQGLLAGAALVHMFFQLKGAYRLSTGGAVWRTGALAIVSLAMLLLFLALVLILGLL